MVASAHPQYAEYLALVKEEARVENEALAVPKRFRDKFRITRTVSTSAILRPSTTRC
jgi:hypothetical protein